MSTLVTSIRKLSNYVCICLSYVNNDLKGPHSSALVDPIRIWLVVYLFRSIAFDEAILMQQYWCGSFDVKTFWPLLKKKKIKEENPVKLTALKYYNMCRTDILTPEPYPILTPLTTKCFFSKDNKRNLNISSLWEENKWKTKTWKNKFQRSRTLQFQRSFL